MGKVLFLTTRYTAVLTMTLTLMGEFWESTRRDTEFERRAHSRLEEPHDHLNHCTSLSDSTLSESAMTDGMSHRDAEPRHISNIVSLY